MAIIDSVCSVMMKLVARVEDMPMPQGFTHLHGGRDDCWQLQTNVWGVDTLVLLVNTLEYWWRLPDTKILNGEISTSCISLVTQSTLHKHPFPLGIHIKGSKKKSSFQLYTIT